MLHKSAYPQPRRFIFAAIPRRRPFRPNSQRFLYGLSRKSDRPRQHRLLLLLLRRATVPMLLFFTGWLLRRGAAAPDVRAYSTDNRALNSAVTELFHPRLRLIFLQLDEIAPRFVVPSGAITILTEPLQFYDTLKSKIRLARRRIFLSSLYIGKSQFELIQILDEALTHNDDLHVSILTDALRGTREAPENRCLALLMLPLVEKHGKHRVDIRMYHTPHLNGYAKLFAPRRLNESWGLQHMKLYGFDDEIMLSGANLSQDYFTNRQDRYYLFRSRELTDYYYGIHEAVGSLLYQLLTSTKSATGFRLSWPTSNKLCDPSLNLGRFISDSSHLLEPLLKKRQAGPVDEIALDDAEVDTLVYPILQFTPLLQPQNDVSTEKPAVLRLLLYLDLPKIEWWFTAGYFNMLPQIQERFINAKSKGSVITAAPQANSFYKSAGISYYVPQAYLLFAKRFLEAVQKRGKLLLISLYEWLNGVVNTPTGWSYHAKGLWITVPDETEPSITVVGSSNYTKRAYLLDLESNALIITKNQALKSAMKQEINHLMEYADRLTLKDFEPKLQPPAIGSESETASECGDSEEAKLKPKYAVDEHRHISRVVHLAAKIVGGSM